MEQQFSTDQLFMLEALREARRSALLDEVPVGAVIVHDGAIIARGGNRRETAQDPTAHAELIAIQAAASALGSWRLCDCTLYVTLEPCTMCMGAIILARIPRLVFGCRDPRAGAAGSVHNFSADPHFNHRVEVTEGVLEDLCGNLLSGFFFSLRERKKAVT